MIGCIALDAGSDSSILPDAGFSCSAKAGAAMCLRRIVHGDTNTSSKKKKKKKKKKGSSKSAQSAKAATSAAPTPAPTAAGGAPPKEGTSTESSVEGIVDPSLQTPSGEAKGSAWTTGPTPPPAATQPGLTATPPGAAPAPAAGGTVSASGGGVEAGVTTSAPATESRTQPWLEAAVELHMFHRGLSYSGDQGQLPPYQLSFAPAPALCVNFYPLGLVTSSAASNLGLAVEYEQAFGLVSKQQGGTVSFPTSSNAFLVGAQYRIPVDPFRIIIRAGYDFRTFSIGNAATEAKPLVPSVDYGAVFAQAFVRWKTQSPVAIDLEGGYHYLLSTGEIGSTGYFPGASGGGVDASLGVTLVLHPVEIQLAGEIDDYFLKLTPAAGGPVASGASDLYVGGRLSASFGLF
jgi:hypothetical protein